MRTIKLHIQDKVFDKVMYFLKNLPENEVEVVENDVSDDWSYLEIEIDKGLNSGISTKSPNWHEEILQTRVKKMKNGDAKYISLKELKSK